MRILIDNQYNTLYDGEFKEYVDTNIIGKLKKHQIDFPNSLEESQKLLSVNNYDLVIITGYDAKILAAIDNKKYDTKVACIIYDMNAEHILDEIEDNGFVSDIISFKSRLIFLCNYILVCDDIVRDQIVELYSSYSKTIDIKSKIVNIGFTYRIKNNETKRRPSSKKYVLIHESINGLTFISRDFLMFVDILIDNKESLPLNLKFVFVCNKFPDKIKHKLDNAGLSNKYEIIKSTPDVDMNNLYSSALCSLFISPLDNNLTYLCDAIFNNCPCMINDNNMLMKSLVANSSILFSIDTLFDDIMSLIRLDYNIKHIIIEEQKAQIIDKLVLTSNDNNIFNI